jgi:hypothetical protein
MHKSTQIPCLLAGAVMLGLVQHASAQVRIEIVNDSGRPDTNIFVMAPGKLWAGVTNDPVTPSYLFANINTATNPATATSVPLTQLGSNSPVAAPYPIVSSISGNTNMVYSFQADYLASGSIYFTYDKPFVFVNGLQPSPPPDSAGNAYRYDYAELSINDSQAPNNAMDVTYVDKFGIPLQMEWFTETNGGTLVSGSYVYLSTKSMVSAFTNNGLGQAVFSLDPSNISPGWQYAGPASYTNFARILAPQKVSGTSSSVSPYPSITNYLNSLVGQPFALNGSAPQGGYYYVGYTAAITTNAGGWLITLTQGTSVPPFNTNILLGTAAPYNIQYTNQITVPISKTNASQYVYGAPVGPNMYATNGVTVVTNLGPAYNVEVWMIGDALSSLNFGFWNGNYGTNSAQWYSPVQWTSFPFGSARPTNDDYYNVYAALIYDYSDPYSFAFSERITPDVLMAPLNGQRVRITLLPDDRMDSPIVAVPSGGDVTTNSITLRWSPVAGATGYQVNALRPLNIAPTNLPSSSSSYTLSGLPSGTPYTMSVQALGMSGSGNPLITPARPVSATTAGPLASVNGNLAKVFAAFGVSDPYFQVQKAIINGVALTLQTNGSWLTTNGGTAAPLLASAGTNQVVLTVLGTNNQVLFNDWLVFTLSDPYTISNNTYSTVSNVFMYGQKLSQPAPTVSPVFGTTTNNFLVSTQNVNLTLGVSYVPAETRRFAPVEATPTPPVSTVLITNVMALPGGGIRFTFNVGAGTNYAVEATTNAASGLWYTNTTGVGQSGGESFTNAAGTNLIQFYRIKY